MSNEESATPIERSGSVVTSGAPTSSPVNAPKVDEVEATVVRLPVEHVDGPFAGVERRRGGSRNLRRRLVTFDALSVAFAWSLAGVLPALGTFDTNQVRAILLLTCTAAIELAAIGLQRLYLGRVASRRLVELAGLSRAAIIAGVSAMILSNLGNVTISGIRVVTGSILSFLLLALLRGVYDSWLSTQRALGLYSRDLVLVGTNAEGLALLELLATHPEIGYRVCGVTGERDTYDPETWPVPYMGRAEETLEVLAFRSADGVLVAASAMDATMLNGFTREMLRHDIHVHLSSGLQGIDHRRLRALPFAHEPLFYLEPGSSSVAGRRLKRCIDVLGAGFVLLVMSPILLAAAVAIRLQDGGPVLFRQRRVGLNCAPFTVYKLRTMVPDAEDRLDEVLESLGNGRDDVLFKLDNDPRRTRVGRLLEATSLDELPQLINVLNGSMSLVGPRPALPDEVAKFDDDLMGRFSVPPGVTGLWQVEARDNPAFAAYRRLDLFYVENWSNMLDLVLIIETLTSVGARVFSRVRGRDGTPHQP